MSAESERERRGAGEGLENRSLWGWGWKGGEWRTLASLIGFFHPKTVCGREILGLHVQAKRFLAKRQVIRGSYIVKLKLQKDG